MFFRRIGSPVIPAIIAGLSCLIVRRCAFDEAKKPLSDLALFPDLSISVEQSSAVPASQSTLTWKRSLDLMRLPFNLSSSKVDLGDLVMIPKGIYYAFVNEGPEMLKITEHKIPFDVAFNEDLF